MRQYPSISIVFCPVFVGELDKLDWVGLDVDCYVDQMAHGVDNGLDEDEDTNQLVKVDVVIQGNDGGQSKLPEKGDGVPEDQSKDQDCIELQDFTTSSGQLVEGIW